MMERTHLAVGVAAALLSLQPNSREQMTAAIVGGAIGGLMSDIDVKGESSRYAGMTAMALTAAMLGVDYTTGGLFTESILAHENRMIIGLILLFALYIIGRRSEHRGRTHSLLFMGLSCGCVYLIDGYMALAFGAGFLSHLAVDILNMQPEKLLYPYPKGWCLKLCKADKFANELFFTLGVSLSAGYMLLLVA